MLNRIFIIFLIIHFCAVHSFGQQFKEDTIHSLSLDAAINLAIDNNLNIKNAALEVDRAKSSQNGIIELSPTDFHYHRGQLHSTNTDGVFTVSQTLKWPFASYYSSKVAEGKTDMKETWFEMTKKKIARDTKIAYFHWVFLHNKKKIVRHKMNLSEELMNVSKKQLDHGALEELEYLQAASDHYSIQKEIKNIRNQISIAENNLKLLLNTNHRLLPQPDTLDLYEIQYTSMNPNEVIDPLFIKYFQKKVTVSDWQIKQQKAKLFPEITAGYFSQSISNQTGFDGWMLGISLPIWFKPQQTRIEQAKIDKAIAENQVKQEIKAQETMIKNLVHKLNTAYEEILYFHNIGLREAESIINLSRKKYDQEEMDYSDYISNLYKAFHIKANYLETVKNYNQIAVELEFFIK
jgi:cobalt-zinc-cadmium resistance protein CzcA